MTSIRVYGVGCALVIALAFAAPIGATTIVMPTDQHLIEKSAVIVRGTVLSSEPVEIRNGIWTETVVDVHEVLKGDAPDPLIVREVGGQIGKRETVVFGSPEFTPGEVVLLFLWPSPRGDFQTMDLFLGKFSEEWTLDGQRLWFRDSEVPNTLLLDRDFEPIEVDEVQRDAAAFTKFVRDRVAGRPGDANYGVADPALLDAVQAHFTLIGEPKIYRWFAFEDGKSVEWAGVGSSGYVNGGGDEAKLAMSSWSGYVDADIRYVWGGMSNQAPGGLETVNGINEVIFGDPLGEISGTWTGNGGVVGRGGFNRISGSRSWTSPFTADGSHTATTYTAYDVTEGNLVIQDGVSPSTGISGTRLAEILAHEFGHTLGFGHSTDTQALMYSSVTGLGPSLRDDDQVAARWLYPGSSTSETLVVPQAPSSLTASALSSTAARLSWSDNSSVETSQTVYIDAGKGFSSLGSVGANVTAIDVGPLTSGKSYGFRVTASNAAGESSPSNLASVTLASDAVTAAFSVSPTSGTAGVTTFSFADQSSGPVSSWQWSFGDGTGSTAQNPSRTYAAAGTYTVTLTVRGSSGQQSSTSRLITVEAAIVPVSSAFSLSPTSGTAGSTTFTFFDQSSGPVSTWQWSFGDGTGSTARNPSRTYASAGTYIVTLTVRGSSGQQSSTSRSVAVSEPEPTVIPFSSLVPVSTAVSGVGGTSWRTSLTMFNASTFSVPVDVVYLPGAGEAARTQRVHLGAGRSVSWQNVLGELFGISNGAGALHFETSSTSGAPDLRIASRTYTDGASGTYGQFVGDLHGASIPQRLHLAGLAVNGEFRSNVGLVNRSASPLTPTLSLYGAGGALLGRTTVALGARSFDQRSLTALFPLVSSVPQDQMSLEIVSPVGNAVTAYASVIDNVSQDPVFVQARPAETGSEAYIAAAGRTAGAAGTYWRSDLTLHNPGAASVTATIRFLRVGHDNRFVSGRTIALGPNGTQTIRDVLTWLGVGDGSGALQIRWSGSPAGIVATSRTYTTLATDSGTLGQSIAMAAASDFGSRAIVTGLASDGRFRTNLGVVNSGDSAIGVALHLTLPDGRRIASASVTVPARSQMQSAAANVFPSVSFANLGTFTVIAETGTPTMFAYGSVIDNQSGDPIFVSGR